MKSLDKFFEDGREDGQNNYPDRPAASVKPKARRHREDISIDKLLLWVYQVQCADKIIDHGVGLHKAEKDAAGIFYKNAAGDGTYAIYQNGLIGAVVDYSGGGAAHIHPDAELVHDLISSKRFTHAERGLLIDYGRTGAVPDWKPGARPHVVPVLRANGKPKIIYADAKCRRPLACEIKVVNDIAHINFCRKVYEVWYAALIKVYDELMCADGCVTSYNVLRPSVKNFPWS